MSDDPVAVVLTKNVRDTRLEGDFLLVISAKKSPNGLGASVAAGVSAFERAEYEYDPAAYDDGTIVARIHPDGTTKWLLENNKITSRISLVSPRLTPVFLATEAQARVQRDTDSSQRAEEL